MAGNYGPKREMVFHSALAKMGPVEVRVDSEPKYLEKKDNWLVELTIDDEKICYWCENEDCAKAFKGEKGNTFMIVAEGRKEEATIIYVGKKGGGKGKESEPEDDDPEPEEKPKGKKPFGKQREEKEEEPERKPEGKDYTNAVAHAKTVLARSCNLMNLCLDAAVFIANTFEDKYAVKLSEEQFRAIASTLFIKCDRAELAETLPVKPLPYEKVTDK